jgi:hypothetical protein
MLQRFIRLYPYKYTGLIPIALNALAILFDTPFNELIKSVKRSRIFHQDLFSSLFVRRKGGDQID